MRSFENEKIDNFPDSELGIFALSAMLAIDPSVRHENALLDEWYNGYPNIVE
jgi:hypothetical protein